ncbi:MAG: CHAT domain-containing protein, partial [Desulfobacterales bacterium]|nr:CHAT domain-containing protein [Desulfobacterales bacterium]
LHDTDFFEGVGFYHTVLGAVYAENGEPDKSQTNFALGRKAFEKIGKDYGLMVNQALQVKSRFIRSGKPVADEDLITFRSFLDKAAAFGAQDIVWRMGYEIGQKLIRDNRPADARIFLEIAIEAIEKTRSKLREDTIKKIFAGSVQDVYGEMIGLLYDMGRHEEGFNYLERAKARAFLDMLAGRSLKAKPTVDPGLVEKGKAIQDEIDVLARQLQTAKGEDRKSISNRYESKLKEMSRTFERIKDQSLSYAATTSVATMSASDIASGLDKNTGLVSYFLNGERLLIWVIRNGKVQATAVPAKSDEIDTLVTEYRIAIDTEEEADVEEIGQALARLLIEPISGSIKGADKLYLVPTGQLHYLPFICLPSAPGRFLIQDSMVSVLPNASSLFYFEGQVTKTQNSIFAIGNPFRDDDQPSLAFAEKEADVVSQAFQDKKILTGETAKETAVKAGNLKGTAIIHIAAHGIYDPEQPLKSSLLLTRDQANDGDLETLEIFSLDLNPKLVVLSACQSGVGEIRRGDEVQSLNRAFLYAGAGGVVASLWSVSDQSTYELMDYFYSALKTQTPGEALRSAQIDLMKTYPSPFHWAAFYLTGGIVK